MHAVASDRDLLAEQLRLANVPPHKLAEAGGRQPSGEPEPEGWRPPASTLRPDFLIISPAKTGSTWLAVNLACHPQLFVAQGKEVKYFSSRFKTHDFNWYLDQFAPARPPAGHDRPTEERGRPTER